MGTKLVAIDKPIRYNLKGITSQDVKQYGDIIQDVSKKAVIPYVQKYKELDWSKVMVQIEKQKYNVVKTDIRYHRDLYLYLGIVSSERNVQHG